MSANEQEHGTAGAGAPVVFRAARADDLAAVPLVHAAGPAAFDYVFAPSGGSSQAFLRHAFVDGAGQMGHRAHVVGVRDGAVVATGTWFSGEDTLAYTAAAVRQILGFYGARAPRILVRGLRMERLIRPPAKRTCYLAHLGVAPTERGTGIGSALVEHLLALGRGAGLARAALDVSVENPRAQALYERLGFRVVDEVPSALPGVPGHRLMQRDI